MKLLYTFFLLFAITGHTDAQEIQSINSGAFSSNGLVYGVGSIYVNAVDIDDNSSGIIGAVTYYEFGTLSIDGILQNPDIQIYPNPFNDFLYIKSDVAIDEATIYDLRGRLILLISDNLSQIDLSALEIGAYIIKFNDTAGTSLKIIKK